MMFVTLSYQSEPSNLHWSARSRALFSAYVPPMARKVRSGSVPRYAGSRGADKRVLPDASRNRSLTAKHDQTIEDSRFGQPIRQKSDCVQSRPDETKSCRYKGLQGRVRTSWNDVSQTWLAGQRWLNAAGWILIIFSVSPAFQSVLSLAMVDRIYINRRETLCHAQFVARGETGRGVRESLGIAGPGTTSPLPRRQRKTNETPVEVWSFFSYIVSLCLSAALNGDSR